MFEASAASFHACFCLFSAFFQVVFSHPLTDRKGSHVSPFAKMGGLAKFVVILLSLLRTCNRLGLLHQERKRLMLYP